MMLSLSMQTKGEDVDLGGLVSGADDIDDRVPHGKVLARFAEAVLQGSETELVDARLAVIDAVGGDAFVDAAGVVGNFERMVRVADATGIPLDESSAQMTVDIRENLGLNDYAMAGRTPPT
jgi:hypothetical protein